MKKGARFLVDSTVTAGVAPACIVQHGSSAAVQARVCCDVVCAIKSSYVAAVTAVQPVSRMTEYGLNHSD